MTSLKTLKNQSRKTGIKNGEETNHAVQRKNFKELELHATCTNQTVKQQKSLNNVFVLKSQLKTQQIAYSKLRPSHLKVCLNLASKTLQESWITY